MSKSEIKQQMGPAEWGMLVALAAVWGGSFFTVGIAVKELPPLTIVACRLVLGAVGLWAFVKLARISMPRDMRVWASFAGMGLLNNAIPFTLIVWGQQHIASGLASILNATTPFFTILVASVLTYDERFSGRKLVGVLIGLGGVGWMVGTQAISGLGDGVLAQLAVLCAAISYGFASVFGKRFKSMGINPVATATGQVSCSAMMLLPMAMFADRVWTLPVPGAATIAAVVMLALASTSLAYILYFRILQSAGATNLALVTFLIPPIATLLGILFLNEVLEARHIAGMVLIFAGLAVIDGRLVKRLGRR